MAYYIMDGYTPPAGVDSASKVKEWQKKLGVKVDGIWGPDTDAAFKASLRNDDGSANFYWGWGDPPEDTGTGSGSGSGFDWSGGSGSGSSSGSGGNIKDFQSYYDAIIKNLEVPKISVDLPGESEVADMWEGILRPGVDSAIEQRRTYARENMAELDADAVSRGMGSSSYVTSMKAREQEDAGEDIEDMEAQYGAQLAERIFDTLNQYRQHQLDVEKYNASARSAAESLALNLASDWYTQYLAQQSAERMQMLKQDTLNSSSGSSSSSGGSSSGSSSSSGGGSKGSSGSSSGSGAKASPRLTTDDYIEYVSNLSASQQKQLFNSDSSYWSVRRDELLDALGNTLFNSLKRKYGG